MERSLRIRRRLRLRDFEMLLALGRERSMARAAAQLAISQAAISKAIAEMEHTLGLPLFDRTARGVEPTLYGRSLLKGAAAVIDDIRQSVNEIEYLADPTVGELRVGSTEPIVAGVLPVILDEMCRRHPRISVHVMESSTVAAQYRDLREREVDLLIGRLLSDVAGEEFNVEILFDDPLLVVVGENNPWTRRRKIGLRDLADQAWTLPRPDTIVRGLFDEAFRAQGIEPPRSGVISNSVQLHINMLSTGRYLAIFPRSMVRLNGKRLGVKTLPVKVPTRPWPVVMITIKNRTVSPTAQVFMEEARRVAKTLMA